MGGVIVSREPKGMIEHSQVRDFKAAFLARGFVERPYDVKGVQAGATTSVFSLRKDSPQFSVSVLGYNSKETVSRMLSQQRGAGGSDSKALMDSIPCDITISFITDVTRGLLLLPEVFYGKNHTVGPVQSNELHSYAASFWFTSDPFELMGWATLLNHQITRLSSDQTLVNAVDGHELAAKISRLLADNSNNSDAPSMTKYFSLAFQGRQHTYDQALARLREDASLVQAIDGVTDKGTD